MNCCDVPLILASDPRDTACERLAAAISCCRQCENDSVQPALSPGAITGQETLARFVPLIHFDSATGTVKPSLFEHARRMGMSVTRVEHTGPDGLARQQETRNYLGYVAASCADIRGVLWEGSRAYCIYDTALQDNTAHADVCQTVFWQKSWQGADCVRLSKSQQSAVRHSLQRVFGRIPMKAGSPSS